MAPKKAAKKVVTPKEPEMVEFVVTQEYLDMNPELIENGIVVGDTIEVSEDELPELDLNEGEKPKGKPAKASKGAMAVLKNGSEYVRTYGADQSEALEEFLLKDAKYSAVPDESVKQLEVPYEIKQKDGTITRTAKRFTDKTEAIRFKNEHRSNCMVVGKI